MKRSIMMAAAALVAMGCGSDADPAPGGVCAGKSFEPGTFSVGVGGRNAVLHVPANLAPGAPAMLVVDLHFGFGNADAQEELSQLRALADARGFMVLQPEGVDGSWNGGKCCGQAWTDATDDVAFVGALLDTVGAERCVDEGRVFATGMSNGGIMAHRLGCDLADRFAAIAPVAAPVHVDANACNPTAPVSVLQFHGTADASIPYEGGVGVPPLPIAGEFDFFSAADSIEAWRGLSGCSGAPVDVLSEGDATCERYEACTAGTAVELCTLTGGGHTWPGGGELPADPFGVTNTDISASERMIDFFEAHPRP